MIKFPKNQLLVNDKGEFRVMKLLIKDALKTMSIKKKQPK